MTQIQRQIDRLVIRLKQQEALKNVRFVREYATDYVETPVRGILAVVGIKETSREKGYIGGYVSSSVKGELYEAKAEIRVYAPQSENGSGLSELVGELLSGLRRADEEKIITEAGAFSIEFDPDLNAIFRRIAFCMEFCLCEEV